MSSPPANPRTRATRSDAQRQAILDAACLLFIDKGFGGTNINDIADAVGVTRTALYYYFPSKESMLQALTEEVTEKAGQLAQTVSGRDELPADEALRLLILQHAGLILSHPLQFRVVERSEGSLPEAHRRVAQAARHSVLEHFVRVIERGIAAGVFRPGDARVAAFSIIGMCNWCAWWFDANEKRSAAQVADSLADYGLRALRSEGGRGKAEALGADDAISQMRQALDRLEAGLLGGSGGAPPKG